jgi:transcription elongation factor Elf1
MDIDSLLETVEAKIVCDQCGNQTTHTVAWLKTNGIYECPVCGDETDLRTEEWTERIQAYIDACTGFDG